ncbi:MULTISPECIES: RHS repeat-associated core domain-containing protein [Pseudomonas]|uniref:RHS repeat-associated core domain-containing protein n=1 Tax=Pseudomonas TaxID=286 RepID=UPI00370A81DB
MNDQSKAVSRQRLGHTLLAYTPFGFLQCIESATRLAFNGQWLERGTQGYLLGSGKRLFNPALMRFSSPDSLSPFGRGGVNAYMYCGGDPVNHTDPSGNAGVKTGFGKFMKQKNVNLAQRTRAKKFLREPMQAIAEQKGTFRFTVKVGSSYIEVNVVDGSFSYASRTSFDLLSNPAKYQKNGIEVSLDHVPMMPVGRGFSSTMDLVPKENTGAMPPITPQHLQLPAAGANLRANLPIDATIDSSEA